MKRLSSFFSRIFHKETEISNSLPTVKFDSERIENPETRKWISENIMTFKCVGWCIDRSRVSQFFDAVVESAKRGGDLAYLYQILQDDFELDKQCASFISLSINIMITTHINIERQVGAGIEYGVWMHSHAGRHPRPSHVAANGKIFRISKGMFIAGKWVLPGNKICCRCTWRPLIPSVDYSVGRVPKGYQEYYSELVDCAPDHEFLYGLQDKIAEDIKR